MARALGLVTVALTREGGGALAQLVDQLVAVSASRTARVQEVHGIRAAHARRAVGTAARVGSLSGSATDEVLVPWQNGWGAVARAFRTALEPGVEATREGDL